MNENSRRVLMDKNESKSTPLSSIFCLTDKSKLKETEKKEDCFILDYVPDDFLHQFSISNNNTNEVSIVAEKGEVACRDFPHSRHNCARYPFSKTNHESYCQLCYCFVCDRVAPCRMWTEWHCHATNNEIWKSYKQLRREIMRLRREVRRLRRELMELKEVNRDLD
ncbi:hypothetical protein DCAR_0313726 [Daucus carota subsp. sativus]|uniref:Uncharacterized protein n=1 Tax=Daucus carota subsp. sativus TaxID=79200 RepID=A0A161WXC2_DAUCS|nr:PREDICTED: uncharacterized protein LOC108213791 [Daucus carota subsp. sativus]WOG94430.1 hypothetical protein DCAR_0313726 [Daucus carota subsp. sativus]